ncbi:WAP four-disulfide core domain [Mactra antiquata]
MVRHGNGLPAPDCISMQEAILLNQALNGGPSGPGTGFSQPRPQQQQPFVPQTQQTFPQQQPGGSIPGVNFLGGGPPPERRGFEDRFRSFQNPQSFTPPGAGFPQQGPGFPQSGGGGWGQPSNINGGMPGAFNTGMGAPQGFIDPVSGAPVNPGFGNTGFGGRVDGGQNSRTSHAGSALGLGQPSVINSVTNQGNAFSSSRGGSFPGENLSPNISPASTETIGQGESRVSTIMEDTYGYYYIFYQTPSSAGYRVNITKDGLCTRYETQPENQPCVTACTSDDQCPRNFKCCPTRCSLGCMPPYEENPVPQQPQPQTSMSRVPDQGSISGFIGGSCRPCEGNAECPGNRFCFYSQACGRRVCQTLRR